MQQYSLLQTTYWNYDHQPEISDCHPETVYGQAYEFAPLQLNFAYSYFSFGLTSVEIDPSKKREKDEPNDFQNLKKYEKAKVMFN